MAQMHLLTGTLVDLGLSPLADRTPYVVVTTNMPGGHPVMDSTGHVVLPTTRVAVNAAGEWAVSLIDTSATDLNIEPDTLQYTLIAEGAPEGMRQSGTVKVGPFPLTSAQRIDQVDADTPAIAPSWRSAFRDEMEALAGRAEAALPVSFDGLTLSSSSPAVGALSNVNEWTVTKVFQYSCHESRSESLAAVVLRGRNAADRV